MAEFRVKSGTHAGVAELADARRSGRSGGSPVRVQIPPSAPAGSFLGLQLSRRFELGDERAVFQGERSGVGRLS